MQAGSGASVDVSSRRRVSRRGQAAMPGEKEVDSKAEEQLEEGLRGLRKCELLTWHYTYFKCWQ